MAVLPTSYQAELPDTTYEETVVLQDTVKIRQTIYLRDKLHDELVKSQFKK